MTVMLCFSDGEAFSYESRYHTLDKVMFEVMSRRFIENAGKLYSTTALVCVGAV